MPVQRKNASHFRRNRGRGAHTDECLVRTRWPCGNCPPWIQLACELKVRSGYNNGLVSICTRNRISEWDRQSVSIDRGLNFASRRWAQAAALGGFYYDVRAEVAEFPLQLALHIGKQ